MFEVSVEETFAAAHALRNYYGKCENLHGHNFKVRVTLEGPEVDEAGMLADFVVLKRVLHDAVLRLDHQNINEVPPFDEVSPSAENMAKFFFDEMRRGLPAGGARISSVKIWETEDAVAAYRP